MKRRLAVVVPGHGDDLIRSFFGGKIRLKRNRGCSMGDAFQMWLDELAAAEVDRCAERDS